MLDIIIRLAQDFRAQHKQLYMVGGTVRDVLLQRGESADADLATDALPEEIKRLVAPTRPSAVVLVGERFGTVRLIYESNNIIEITTFRSERYNPESRKPEVCFGTDLAEDLQRRDFTINALARDPLNGSIIDLFAGRQDLEEHIIRAVGNEPDKRFDEDPLRLLRAIRFAAQLDFEIESSTWQSIKRQANKLQKISRERIRDEMNKLLVSAHPAKGLDLLVEAGLMEYIMPEVMELRGVSQQPTPRAASSKDVYAHVLRVVERTQPKLKNRWCGLLHDIAKPRTKSVEDHKVHFFGHEDVGAHMARDILKRLHFDREFIDSVSRVVRLHMRANAYTIDWTDGAVRRLMLDADHDLPTLLDLSSADITSYRVDKVARATARVAELTERCQRLREEAERVPIKSPLDGNELMQLFERGPGPWLRPLKEYLLSLVIDGALASDDKERAVSLAKEFVEREKL
ncbi:MULTISPECIES: CCA tRNA nucleotidyltransferase [Ktedonobacter]|uniref:Polynucleotide adenylyltransferase/metal dependent phosphohydrolase n=2 Tax=Ktedonobacter TaxID=363276 RepID=D6THX9_KTERA|nr:MULTISPECIES: CCA tRNA nucleotidyltransferase [Ktedonobacter]EFH90949.1 polynucleotide adenylyltransferase/metal dependent phosphohydrolase [Ktedonobacter racemifer DSM 44963]GHO53579.1 CCA tRNA nucleotidyltransferase [Ktedonobacter robiniae]GHO68948.1 CCA tRNA nucleotidyltransferase [Ktedonobacter sp. SOSP1-52]